MGNERFSAGIRFRLPILLYLIFVSLLALNALAGEQSLVESELDSFVQLGAEDYAVDPIRKSYRSRVRFPPIDIARRTRFVESAIAPSDANTRSLIRVKLLDGRYLNVRDGRPVQLFSIEPADEVFAPRIADI